MSTTASNPANASTSVEDFEATLPYRFKDSSNLSLALTHSTFASEARLDSSNERLEFLGDSVLGFSVTQRLYRQYPAESEGELSRRRQSIVSNRNLAVCAKEMNLAPALQLGAGQRSSEGLPSDSILANTVEALIGALYLDGGNDAVETVFGRYFDSWVAKSDSIGDPKSRLQEHCHQTNLDAPAYRLIEEIGPDHAKLYTWEVQVSSETTRATETSKTKAQRKAARLMLEHLEIT